MEANATPPMEGMGRPKRGLTQDRIQLWLIVFFVLAFFGVEFGVKKGMLAQGFVPEALFLSLVASIVLYYFLDTIAKIERRSWSMTGAGAVFGIIFAFSVIHMSKNLETELQQAHDMSKNLETELQQARDMSKNEEVPIAGRVTLDGEAGGDLYLGVTPKLEAWGRIEQARQVTLQATKAPQGGTYQVIGIVYWDDGEKTACTARPTVQAGGLNFEMACRRRP